MGQAQKKVADDHGAQDNLATDNKLFLKPKVKEMWDNELRLHMKALTEIYKYKTRDLVVGTKRNYRNIEKEYSTTLMQMIIPWCKQVEECDNMMVDVSSRQKPWCSERDIFRILIGIVALADRVFVKFDHREVSLSVKDPERNGIRKYNSYKSQNWRSRWVNQNGGHLLVGPYKRALELIIYAERYISSPDRRGAILDEIKENESDISQSTLNTACQNGDLEQFTTAELLHSVKMMGLDPLEREKRQTEYEEFIKKLQESSTSQIASIDEFVTDIERYQKQYNTQEPTSTDNSNVNDEIATRFFQMAWNDINEITEDEQGNVQKEGNLLDLMKKCALFTRTIDSELAIRNFDGIEDFSGDEEKDKICRALFGSDYPAASARHVFLRLHPDRCINFLHPQFKGKYPNVCNNAFHCFTEVKNLLTA